jgi:hypothetical protein
MSQRKSLSNLSGRIHDESSQPIPQSRPTGNMRSVAIDVLLDKIGDLAQLSEGTPCATRYMRDVAMASQPTGFTLALKPKLDDERMNCGLC